MPPAATSPWRSTEASRPRPSAPRGRRGPTRSSSARRCSATPTALPPPAYVLWTRSPRHTPATPGWFDRDRYILSAGHASMLLYSLRYLTGYGLTLDDIKQFRQWGSKTPGHPEHGHTVGVETTTGPLGQGFANGVGMAIAERELAARYNRPGFPVVEHFTYAICSDG